MNAKGDSEMEEKQINDSGPILEAPGLVSALDDDQGPQTCIETITTQDGEQRRCKGKPIMGDRFCYHHSDRISPELEKLDILLKERQEDFFCNNDVRLEVGKLLEGFRPCTKVDREFAAKLAAHWKKVRRQGPGR
jgi:hypothetical protein